MNTFFFRKVFLFLIIRMSTISIYLIQHTLSYILMPHFHVILKIYHIFMFILISYNSDLINKN
jgi:hypothetical protein